MKYGAEQEKELMTEIWSPYIKDDPYNFVKFIFPWGQKDTPLEDFEGPRKWQEEILKKIIATVTRNIPRAKKSRGGISIIFIGASYKFLLIGEPLNVATMRRSSNRHLLFLFLISLINYQTAHLFRCCI